MSKNITSKNITVEELKDTMINGKEEVIQFVEKSIIKGNENENENENEIKIKTKTKRVKWTLDKELLTLTVAGTILDLKDTIYDSLSDIDKFVYIHGIKQSCSDSGAGIKDFRLRKNAILERFNLFINKDTEFLPSGRVALTPEEKLVNKVKKVKSLVNSMIQGGMSEEIAISIAEKTFK